jgi:hypothetical protein
MTPFIAGTFAAIAAVMVARRTGRRLSSQPQIANPRERLGFELATVTGA